MDDDGRHAGRVPGSQPKHRQRDHPQPGHPQDAAEGHPSVLLDVSDHWTIEYNEIASNQNGHPVPEPLHHQEQLHPPQLGTNPSASNAAERGGGYVGYYASDTTFDTNEIAYNGMEQKMMDSVNVTFRNNFVHHNVGDGIWYNGGNPGALVEGNRVEDNGANGIF